MPPALQPQTTEPLKVYEQYVAAGRLANDDAQRQVIEHLQALHDELVTTGRSSALARLLPFCRSNPPQSLYIWGAVGRGKSLLMDLFYQSVPVSARRIHFHAFMSEVHTEIHAFRQRQRTDINPVEHVATVIASRLRLLCLDELEVKDVADAMILGKLFTTLMSKGVTCVITSNRPPEELYLGGLQRERFMAFVDFVYARMNVLQLASLHDYRMQQIRALQTVYLWPLTEEARNALETMFLQLTHYAEPMPSSIEVQGRKLAISRCYGGIASFTFNELCEKPLGPADYLAIAHRFHTVFLSGIPQMEIEKRNEARS
jgi:cell division protein ZapE